MLKITFYGAAKEVTGSCFLVEGEKIKLLVDCGLFQGGKFASRKNYDPLPFACGEIKNVLVTHAHLDHTGRLPSLCMEGFRGKIYATAPTLDMIKFLWADAADIMEIDYAETGKLPLYSPAQAKKAMKYFQGVKYGEKIALAENDYAVFHDAGHILGSASIELVIDNKRIVFSGDVGNTNPPIINETEKLPADIDLLVCESTYGNRKHESKTAREKAMFGMVKETLGRGGTLLIPAFSIERTQELLYILNNLVEEKKIPFIPIFLDSPLGIEITSVFRNHPEFFNEKDKLLQQGSDGLFTFPGLTFTKTRKQSKQINKNHSPKIIIAGGGMMNGGRITFHLQRYLGDRRNTLFIVGYQARGTLGRKLLDGAKQVRINRSTVRVKAHVHAIGAYSAHADQNKLLAWMKQAKGLKKVALVHGEADQMAKFSKKIEAELNLSALTPNYKSSITL